MKKPAEEVTTILTTGTEKLGVTILERLETYDKIRQTKNEVLTIYQFKRCEC